jgi:3-deoxy-D-manno-octulosonic-acid transferase
MEEAVRKVRPKVMILLEMEIWPGLIKALKEHGCEIFIINGRITEKSLKKYMKFPWLWNYLTPDNILAITKEDAERFRQLFAKSHIDIMPNIKFDRISFNARPESKFAPLGDFINDNNPFVVLASVRQEEEGDVEKIIKHIKAVYPSIVIGLFPRHKHRIRAWKELLRKKGYTWELRSKVKSRVAGGTVILWDIFGELTAAYSIASSAFVGGSLRPLGGQNFLEAVSCGVVPVIGPHWNDFFWVGEEIFELGLAKQASGWKEVANIIVQSLNNLPSRDKTLKKCLMYIKEHQGGADMACRLIEDIL